LVSRAGFSEEFDRIEARSADFFPSVRSGPFVDNLFNRFMPFAFPHEKSAEKRLRFTAVRE
jgi:hypothetical protein